MARRMVKTNLTHTSFESLQERQFYLLDLVSSGFTMHEMSSTFRRYIMHQNITRFTITFTYVPF